MSPTIPSMHLVTLMSGLASSCGTLLGFYLQAEIQKILQFCVKEKRGKNKIKQTFKDLALDLL